MKGNRNGKMDPLHKQVADAYLADPELNQTRAYMSVYPDCAYDSARTSAAAVFAKPNVTAYIQEKMHKREARTEITQDWVLRELAKVAGFDPRKLFEDDGSVKLVSQWDDSTAASVSDISTVELFSGSNEQKHAIGLVKKVQSRDKIKALELLGKHLGMFRDKVEVTGANGKDLFSPEQILGMAEVIKRKGSK